MHRLFDTSCFVFRFLRKTNCVRFGKAGAHPQLAWESQLPLKPCILIAASRLKRQLRFFRFPSRFLLQFYLKVRFAPQMWATRPHLASIFEKLLDQKTFWLPAARFILMFNAQIFVPEAESPAGQRVPVLHPILPLAEYPQRYT